MTRAQTAEAVTVEVLSEKLWPDYESLFCSAAIPGRCWCMWWRTTQKEAIANRGEGNKRAMHEKVRAGETVGLIAYADGEPVGWCSAGPRESFPRILRSQALTPVDGAEPPPGTWSTVCYFVHRKHRKKRIAHALLKAAVELAETSGAPAFEGYPVKPRDGKLENNSAFPGLKSMYDEAGFEEVPSKAPDRSIQMIMRRTLS
jgi:GNAT superfamily N-acetyltransferase